ncbi:tyrosine-type recombinase/integrase [Listeria cossartiae]|uniref:tyrosine-type recombinase/integrase n=1 Tax=Listeria cossartiae TaxID=2838249 RepID=UPI001E385D16|nr:tyrosine-type recombinase/integrase [Listeria cossartiae]MCD2225582.1 tyrosine-type recombinase/integrase [Listeria cossartiae]MCD2240333.1 tyrosine-type recombinase/integrase [Listeria cossartiae]
MYELNEMLEEYLITLKAEGKVDITIKTRRKHIEPFFAYLYATSGKNEKIDLTDVTRRQIREYITYMLDRDLSPVYLNNILKSIRSIFRYMVDEGYLKEEFNPAPKVKALREKRTLITTFTDKEIQALISVYKRSNAFLPTRNKLIIMLFADTGIRISELIKLKDCDFQGTSVNILGKGNKQRVVFLSPLVAKQLAKFQRIKRQYFKHTGAVTEDYLFVNFYGKRLTPEGVNMMLKRTAERTGHVFTIRISCHTLRHYFSQKYIENGDIYTLSRLLGHSNLETTRTYLRSMSDVKVIEKGIQSSPMTSLGIR